MVWMQGFIQFLLSGSHSYSGGIVLFLSCGTSGGCWRTREGCMKRCSVCRETKSLSEFHKGGGSRCKPCACANTRAWYRAHREERCAYQRQYGRSNRTRLGVESYNRHLKSLYGITSEDYDRMYQEQKGLCALCSRSSTSGRHLDVDHDHTTGKVRGLLCVGCNRFVGRFEQNFLGEKTNEYLREVV